ncbi:hypothetical protein KIH75_09170 [Bifidobacterium sp. 64T4]|uniref:hypothetical protein n=1 Tax=Bifidobacterium pongonis TaxID=2834432 RepID=UPI001C58C6D2|nr:hypothetical protein [Bifidobacterium pongonis]MBW3095493.1 hypothetical protein [Bifidobacterium pongonis]
MRIVIRGSRLGGLDGDDTPPHSGNATLDGILGDCRPIEPDASRTIEFVFEGYIIYQVRNESYCVYDSSESRTGKYLAVFEKSALLDDLSVSTSAQRWDDGTCFPYRWKHYGVYTQNHVIDIVSHDNPQVYRYDSQPSPDPAH